MKDTQNVNVTKSGGLGICSILTIIFVLLKAFGIINFTWFQCFLPLIIGAGIVLVIFLIALVVVIVSEKRW